MLLRRCLPEQMQRLHQLQRRVIESLPPSRRYLHPSTPCWFIMRKFGKLDKSRRHNVDECVSAELLSSQDGVVMKMHFWKMFQRTWNLNPWPWKPSQSWPDYRNYLCKFWFIFLHWSRRYGIHKISIMAIAGWPWPLTRWPFQCHQSCGPDVDNYYYYISAALPFFSFLVLALVTNKFSVLLWHARWQHIIFHDMHTTHSSLRQEGFVSIAVCRFVDPSAYPWAELFRNKKN